MPPSGHLGNYKHSYKTYQKLKFLEIFLTDVLVLNDIINQTASSDQTGGNLSVEAAGEQQPRNSLQSGTGSNLAVSNTAMALERARRESRKISMMLDDEEDEGPRLKEKITEACQQFIDIFCVWDCCWVYIKLSEVSPIHQPYNTPTYGEPDAMRSRAPLNTLTG